MNLAYRDLRRRPGRFVATALGVGLLFAVVLAMQGIYAGLVDDTTILTRVMAADLWVVQHGTRGPFAEASRLDPTLLARIHAVPGVVKARSHTYQVIQRELHGRAARLAIVGLAWPDDIGQALPVIAGRRLAQAHGEMIADASLGWPLGDTVVLAGERYRVVGLTRSVVSLGGDPVAFLALPDAQAVANEQPDASIRTERERTLARLRSTDLGRSQPALEDLAVDDRFAPPALPPAAVNAILVNATPFLLEDVRRILSGWGEVSVYSQREQDDLLLEGVVERARMQIGLFTVILTATASVIVMMVLYTLTLEKTHDLAVLKLMGTPAPRLIALVLEQAWLLGAVGYVVALALAATVFPHFPRRVVVTAELRWLFPAGIFVLTTIASVLGVVHATRVNPSLVLES